MDILLQKAMLLFHFFVDLQDPPDLINDFISKWEEGYDAVVGVKTSSKENSLIFFLRKIFYNIIESISETDHIKNFNGFGLFDKSFWNIVRNLNEPHPYFRGMVAEFAPNRIEIEYIQEKRRKGKSKNNLYRLYDSAMLAFVSHSKVPLRLATFIGFLVSFFSYYCSYILFFYKNYSLE